MGLWEKQTKQHYFKERYIWLGLEVPGRGYQGIDRVFNDDCMREKDYKINDIM